MDPLPIELISMTLEHLNEGEEGPWKHATLLAEGRQAFRIKYAQACAVLERHSRALVVKEGMGAPKQAKFYLYLLTQYSRELILDVAWHIFSVEMWRQTITRLNGMLGHGGTGRGLPFETTPDYVLKHVIPFTREGPPDPDGEDVRIEIMLPDHEMRQLWHGDARVRKGKFKDIMKSSKMPEINRGLRDGSVKLE